MNVILNKNVIQICRNRFIYDCDSCKLFWTREVFDNTNVGVTEKSKNKRFWNITVLAAICVGVPVYLLSKWRWHFVEVVLYFYRIEVDHKSCSVWKVHISLLGCSASTSSFFHILLYKTKNKERTWTSATGTSCSQPLISVTQPTNVFICNDWAQSPSCHLFVRFLGVNLSKGKLLKILFALINPSV